MGRGESEPALVEAPLRAGSAADPAEPLTEEELARYADRLLEAAGVSSGDTLALELYHPEQLAVVQSLTARAFAREITVEVIIPPLASPSQVSGLLERGASFLSLSTTSSSSESRERSVRDLAREASAMGISPPETSTAAGPDAWAGYREAKERNQLRWGVALWPSRAWAAEVYPELSPPAAHRQLALDVLEFMRASEIDSPTSWSEHVRSLEAKAAALSELEIDRLEITTGSGTELQMEIAAGSRFRSCEMKTESGERFLVNAPTEEVFATPRAASVSGKLKATKPLVVGDGGRIEGIEITMEGGEITEISFERAYDSAGEFPRAAVERWLDQEFSTEGMSRIGELGLVDRSSRIARSGRVYMNTLLDENAGLHLGFGNSYDQFTGGEGNSSVNHLDICVGSDDQRVVAVTSSGERVAVIDKGLWQI